MAEFHRKIERSAIGFVLAIVGVASIGGFVEIAPLFTIDETVEERARHAGLHAARTGRPQHLHPRGLLRLPFADDPHAAGRGRALRSLFAGGRIEIRPSDAVGIEADGTGPCPRRRQIFRRLACRPSDQSPRRRAGIGHAEIWLAAAQCAEDRRSRRASHGDAPGRRPLHGRDDRQRHQRRARPGDARQQLSRAASPSATARRRRSGRSTAILPRSREMDGLVAYLQILGHLTDAAHKQASAATETTQ